MNVYKNSIVRVIGNTGKEEIGRVRYDNSFASNFLFLQLTDDMLKTAPPVEIGELLRVVGLGNLVEVLVD